MVKPSHFSYNVETASSNFFQNEVQLDGNEITERALKEFEQVQNVFNQFDIEVKVFDSGEDELPDAVFPNNWIAQLPGGAVTIFPMLTEIRRREIRQDIIDWVCEITNTNEVLDLSKEVHNEQFLEGTGSIVFDHQNKIAYACESERTNVALFEKYCSQIAYAPLSFASDDLKGHPIYHTNVMMSIAGKYCLINLDSMSNTLERTFCKMSLERSGKEVIPISFKQMNDFAGNVFEVLNRKDESCLVMSERAYESLNNEQIDTIKRYSKIVRVSIETIEKVGGGGIRCMMAGLHIPINSMK